MDIFVKSISEINEELADLNCNIHRLVHLLERIEERLEVITVKFEDSTVNEEKFRG